MILYLKLLVDNIIPKAINIVYYELILKLLEQY
jgi:hypothetical protein